MATHTLSDLMGDEQVPDFLKEALLSEVDLIRDTLEIVTLFTGFFVDTALMVINDDSSDRTPSV